MTKPTGPGAAATLPATRERRGLWPAYREPDRRQQRRWVPRAAGWLAMLIGLADVILGAAEPGLLYRHVRHPLLRVAQIAPGTLSNFTRVADVIIGLLLLMLSHGLRRRKHRAWQAVMAALAVSVAIHVIHERLGATAVTAGLLIALVVFRREFYAVGDPARRWRALWMLAALLAADLAIGLTFIAMSRGMAGGYSLAQRTASVLDGLVGVTGPVRFLPDSRNDVFAVLTGGLGLFTLIVTAYLFLRPARPPSKPGLSDEARIRDLLGRHGCQDSLGYFTLRDDKSIVWSASGKACIGYRVLSGVMLATGDPIGDPEAWPGAIHAFLDEAARHAWVPAVLGCGELGAETWCRVGGLAALELGDEAVVEVAAFTLQGRAMRNARQMVTRVERNGYTAQVRRVADMQPAELASLARQADSWRGNQAERGFSMALGRLGGSGDEDCVIATATEGGVLSAVLHFVPWGADGLSLDLMRRDRSVQSGLNDFLIVETIRQAPALGVRRVSLNFAVFRAALERGERIGAGPVLRAWRRILVFLSRWFQIESLYRFNAKFCPDWVPRFLVYPSPSDLPRIGLAALSAEAFLVWPTVEFSALARSAWPGWLSARLRGAERATVRGGAERAAARGGAERAGARGRAAPRRTPGG
ncbi:MAG TPA: phosphatidylglycerol lysyltransferase domain-containing protein [Streptosporangiaceae bacterium]